MRIELMTLALWELCSANWATAAYILLVCCIYKVFYKSLCVYKIVEDIVMIVIFILTKYTIILYYMTYRDLMRYIIL